MGTISDRLASARSTPEAFKIIAEGLDLVLEKLEQADAGEWGTPWTPPGGGQTVAEFDAGMRKAYANPLAASMQAPLNDERIAQVRALLERVTDPEDRQALEAELRLLHDRPVPDDLYTPGDSAHVEYDPTSDTSTVELPVPSADRMAARAQWAVDHKLDSFLPRMDRNELLTSFAKGGPLWLYHVEEGRDALLAMPVEWRAAMVADIEQDSPRLAQEVGRDLLKQEEAIDPQAAVAHLNALAERLEGGDV